MILRLRRRLRSEGLSAANLHICMTPSLHDASSLIRPNPLPLAQIAHLLARLLATSGSVVPPHKSAYFHRTWCRMSPPSPLPISFPASHFLSILCSPLQLRQPRRRIRQQRALSERGQPRRVRPHFSLPPLPPPTPRLIFGIQIYTPSWFQVLQCCSMHPRNLICVLFRCPVVFGISDNDRCISLRGYGWLPKVQ